MLTIRLYTNIREVLMSTVDPKKRAIIMIDMARDFVEEGGFIANAGSWIRVARHFNSI